MHTAKDRIDLGVGVGLRVPHYRRIIEERPDVDFFEVISENFMVEGGKPLYHLDRVLETYKVVQHGVSLGIGNPSGPDADYLRRLKELTRRTNTPWVTDHFCWGAVQGQQLHDLLPLPYTKEAVARVAERARRIQGTLELPFALENTSSYLTYSDSTMTEWQFISEIAEQADVGLMFDVNNVYVSAYNHDFDPYEFIRNVPHERILQIHLAGHTNLGDYIIDTHNGPVIDPVVELYRHTIELAGPVSTLIEWDDDIPELPVLIEEAERIRSVRNSALSARAERKARGVAESAVPAPTGPYRFDRPVAPRENLHGWKQGGPREREAVS